MLGRRMFVAGGAAIGAGLGLAPQARAARQEEWASFRERFVSPEGRVLDTGNGGISHTEGQGYGMLFAQHADDRGSFERLWTWTEQNLRQTGTPLHAWKYIPGAADPVPDPSSATDGELILALALSRAGRRWGDEGYRRAAQTLYRAVREKLVVRIGGRSFLLPGQNGFVFPQRTVINPSYYVFPALQDAAQDDPVWYDIIRDGQVLLAVCRFGKWFLPPDWVELTGGGLVPAPAQGWPPRFSYNAVRVPLYMWWGRVFTDEDQATYSTFWNTFGSDHLPAWVDVTTNQCAPYSGPEGFRAIALCTGLTYDGALSDVLPSVLRSNDYYSAALCMLARLASDDVLT